MPPLCGKLRPSASALFGFISAGNFEPPSYPQVFLRKGARKQCLQAPFFEGFGTNLQIILDFRDKIRYYILAPVSYTHLTLPTNSRV